TENRKLHVCEAATGKVRQSFPATIPQLEMESLEHVSYKARQGMGWPFALTPDDRTLVVGGEPGHLRRFDVATGKEIAARGAPMVPATALVFTPDGKKLVAAGGGKVVLHDLERKGAPLQLEQPVPADRDRPKPLHVAVSRDG